MFNMNEYIYIYIYIYSIYIYIFIHKYQYIYIYIHSFMLNIYIAHALSLRTIVSQMTLRTSAIKKDSRKPLDCIEHKRRSSHGGMVLVEYVPTSFGYVFHAGMHFSNTRHVECRGR